MQKMAEAEMSTTNDSCDEATSSDESEDVSSTYCSDEEMDCTCILSPKVTAGKGITDPIQKEGGEINITLEDVKELQQLDFENNSGTALVFPRNYRQYLEKDVLQRLDFLATQRTTVAVVLPSTGILPGFSKTCPDDLMCDLIVISPRTSTLILTILTITHTDQSSDSRVHNTSLARDLTAYIRKKSLGSFKAVHGVILTSDFSSNDTFTKKVLSLEHEALLTSIQHTVRLSYEKCRAVLSALISLFEESSAELLPDSNQQQQEKRISLYKSLPEDCAKRFPRQLLNQTEMSFVRDQRSSDFLMVPTSMHNYIRKHHPVILDHIRHEMGGKNGWVLAQTSLLNRLTTSNTVPSNVFCDVTLMAEFMPMKVLTFATSDLQNQSAYSYNDNLVCKIKEKFACGHDYRIEKKVIFLDERAEKVTCIKQTTWSQGLLSSQPSGDILYKKISNSLLHLFPSQQQILGRLDQEEDDRTDDDAEFPSILCHAHKPRLTCTLSWNLDGKCPFLVDFKFKINWILEKSSDHYETGFQDEDNVCQFVKQTMSHPTLSVDFTETETVSSMELRPFPNGYD